VLSEEEGTAGAPPIVEIAHEQMVRSRETLRAWLNEDRQRLAEMEPLRAWVEAAKGASRYVLRGDQLALANALLMKYRSELDAAERGLIERSRAAEVRRRRWARATGVAAALAVVVMGVLAYLASTRATRAVHAESVAYEAAMDAGKQAARARTAAQMAGARELVTHGHPTMASRLLLEVEDPERTPPRQAGARGRPRRQAAGDGAPEPHRLVGLGDRPPHRAPEHRGRDVGRAHQLDGLAMFRTRPADCPRTRGGA
jgi:hypothetical protein